MQFKKSDIFGKFLWRGNVVKKKLFYSLFAVVLCLAACSEEEEPIQVVDEHVQDETTEDDIDQDDNLEE